MEEDVSGVKETTEVESTSLVPAAEEPKSGAIEPEVLDAVEDGTDDFVPDTEPMVSVEADDSPKVDSNEVRKRTLTVKDNIDACCVEMCALIRTIQVKQLWMNWGYPSLKEYCEQELGMKRSRALYFAQAYKFAEREGEESFREVMSLGWTKGVQLIRVANKETLTEWMTKAKHQSVDTLTREVQVFLAKKIPDEPKEALAQANEVEDTQTEEESKTMTITFPYVDYLAASQAIDMVSVATPGLSKGQALGLICGEYAASNALTDEETQEAKANGKAAILKQILRLSNMCGIRIMALDPDSGDFLHGFEDFKELVQKTFSDDEVQEAVESVAEPVTEETTEPVSEAQ